MQKINRWDGDLNSSAYARISGGARPKRSLLSLLILQAVLFGTALLIQSCQHAKSSPSGEDAPVDQATDEEWLTARQFQTKFDQMFSEGFYPYEIEGKCESGYEQFGAKWTGLPLGWTFYARNGVPREKFEEYNKQYLSIGYTLEYTSEFDDCSGKTRYQGVWIKKGS